MRKDVPKLFKRCQCPKASWEKCEHNWFASFKVHGKREEPTTGTSNREVAIEEACRLRREAREAPGPRTGDTVRLSQLAAAHIAQATQDVAEGAICKERRQAIIDHWNPPLRFFQDRPEFEDVSRLTPAALAEYRDHRLLTVKPVTVSREFWMMKTGMALGQERGWKVPHIIRWPRIRGSGKKSNKDPARSGKADHRPEYIRAVRAEMDDELRDRIDFDVTSSLRKHELLRFHISWVLETPQDFKVPALIRVPGAKSKDRDDRVIPLTPKNLEIIKRRYAANLERAEKRAYWERRKGRKQQRDFDPGIVFPGDRKKALYAAIERAQAKLIKEHGQEEAEARGYLRNLTLRDLRSTFGTVAEHKTKDQRAIADIYGHTTLKTTAIYLHSTLDRMAEATLAVDEWYSDLLEGGTGEGGHTGGYFVDGRQFHQLFRGEKLVGARGIEPPTPTVSSQAQSPNPAESQEPTRNERNAKSRASMVEGGQGGGTGVVIIKRRSGGAG